MISKNEIIERAYECGFGDIGFTTADPFETQKELLQERYQDYEWTWWPAQTPNKSFPRPKPLLF
jgi:epoxyqueuosine reductase QueG